ncbi:hypothetical protein COB57_01910 [Candidatus Peregrinibacteria bacterium]|nr:MAG: hypothetical protein COB57_01910 [Candidatus Peregrinibacteria bacterium]
MFIIYADVSVYVWLRRRKQDRTRFVRHGKKILFTSPALGKAYLSYYLDDAKDLFIFILSVFVFFE